MTVTSSNTVAATTTAPKPNTLTATPSAPLSGPAAVLDLSPDAQKFLGRVGSHNVPWGNAPGRH